MSENRAEHRITTMSRLLGVSASGYYAWEQREPSAREHANQRLLARIRTIHMKSRETYGAPRVIEDLIADQVHVGHNRVARLMREAGLVGASRRKRLLDDASHQGRSTRARPGRTELRRRRTE